MTKKNERLLTTLTNRYFADILSQPTLRQIDKKAISSAAKNMAHEFAKIVVEERLGSNEYTRTTIQSNKLKFHVENMCDMLGIDQHKLFAKTKGRLEISTSRSVIIYLLRKKYGKMHAHETILAQLFGRDRSSILHNLKTAKIMIQIKDPLFMGIYNIVKDYKFESYDN